jgi:hypothetical protein
MLRIPHISSFLVTMSVEGCFKLGRKGPSQFKTLYVVWSFVEIKRRQTGLLFDMVGDYLDLWRLHNNVIFNGVIPVASTLLDDIKVTSWMWLTRRYDINSCIPLSCWCIELMTCFQSS